MNMRPLLPALLALLLLPSCATCYWVDFKNYKPEESKNYVFAAFLAPIWIPCAFAFDLVTWPIQFIGGFNPFGDRGKHH